MLDIANYEGLYAVTRLGMVWSYRSSKWLKPFANNRGYHVVRLFNGGKCQSLLVHRLVAAAYVHRPVSATDVNHLDGSKTNNAAANLEWCTHRENIDHAVRTGLYRRGPRVRSGLVGSRHAMAKLSESDIPCIRDAWKHGETGPSIASRYGVSVSLVSQIVNNNRWTHV